MVLLMEISTHVEENRCIDYRNEIVKPYSEGGLLKLSGVKWNIILLRTTKTGWIIVVDSFASEYVPVPGTYG
jgi:hypothetical protein